MILRLLLVLAGLSLTTTASAVDATRYMTEITKSGHWKVVEFAGPQQVLYRLASDAINEEETHLVFDFVPSRKCEPTPATMIKRMKFSPALEDGYVPFAYKIPTQAESLEAAKTTMARGDSFAFFQFEHLTTKALRLAKDKGNLAIWIPASGDRTVQRSGNIYFAMKGFSSAYGQARKRCNDNR